jgi:hypothetical protein
MMTLVPSGAVAITGLVTPAVPGTFVLADQPCGGGDAFAAGATIGTASAATTAADIKSAPRIPRISSPGDWRIWER